MSATVSVTFEIKLSDDLVLKLFAGTLSSKDLEEILQSLRTKQSTAKSSDESKAKNGTGPYTAKYQNGDELFNEEFPIDTSGGNFLGECGVNITKGYPGVAFDIWLFDKTDIKTATKIWATRAGMNNPVHSQLLVHAPEVLLLTEGATMTVESKSMRLTATVNNVQMDGDTVLSAEFTLNVEVK